MMSGRDRISELVSRWRKYPRESVVTAATALGVAGLWYGLEQWKVRCDAREIRAHNTLLHGNNALVNGVGNASIPLPGTGDEAPTAQPNEVVHKEGDVSMLTPLTSNLTDTAHNNDSDDPDRAESDEELPQWGRRRRRLRNRRRRQAIQRRRNRELRNRQSPQQSVAAEVSTNNIQTSGIESTFPLWAATARFLLFPLLGTTAVWVLALSPDHRKYLAFVPRLRLPGVNWIAARKAMLELLRMQPQNKLQAYELGVLSERLSAGNGNSEFAILAAGAEIVGLDRPFTRDEFVGIHNKLVQEASQLGVLKRIGRGLSLVNLLWAASVFGGLITVGPVVFIVGRGIARLRFVRRFGQRVARLLDSIWERVLAPVIHWCHRFGVYDCLIHLSVVTLQVFAVEVQGNMPGKGLDGLDRAGYLFSVPATMLFLPALIYSLFRTDHRDNRRVLRILEPPSKWNRLVGFIPCAYLAPQAIAHQSNTWGFATTGAFNACHNLLLFVVSALVYST